MLDLDSYEKDWRLALFAKITQWTQENEINIIPILAEWDLNQERESLLVPSLVEILGLSETEEIPHLFLYSPNMKHVEAYPEKLDDIKNFSPELVMTWAEMIVAQ
jgi:hypothetical protein